MPLRKVHELTFLWFGLPGPLLIPAGHTPVRLGLSGRNAGKFREQTEALSELFLEFPSRARLGSPQTL